MTDDQAPTDAPTTPNAPAAPAPAAPPAPAGPAAPDAVDTQSPPTSAEYSVAFSPRQAAVGFAIVAGLIAIAIRRRRGRKNGGED